MAGGTMEKFAFARGTWRGGQWRNLLSRGAHGGRHDGAICFRDGEHGWNDGEICSREGHMAGDTSLIADCLLPPETYPTSGGHMHDCRGTFPLPASTIVPPSLLGIIWVPFGHHLGIIWASSGHHLGIIWTSFGHHLAIIWASSGYHLDIIWASSGHHELCASVIIHLPSRGL